MNSFGSLLLCIYHTLITSHLSSGHLNTLLATNDCPSSLTDLFLLQAETRAEFSERSVAKLEKSIDDLEGTSFIHSVISAPVKFSFICVIVKYSERLLLSLQVIKLSAFYFSTVILFLKPSALLAFFQLSYRFSRTIKHYLFRRDQSLCRSTHTDFTLFCKMTLVLLSSNYTQHLNLIRLLWAAVK